MKFLPLYDVVQLASSVKFHRVNELTEVIVQLHEAMVPGWRGTENEALHEKLWASAEVVEK